MTVICDLDDDGKRDSWIEGQFIPTILSSLKEAEVLHSRIQFAIWNSIQNLESLEKRDFIHDCYLEKRFHS